MKLECVAVPGRACEACTKQKSRCSISAWGKGGRSGGTHGSGKAAPRGKKGEVPAPESSVPPKRRRRTITAEGGQKKKIRMVTVSIDDFAAYRAEARRTAARAEGLRRMLASIRHQIDDLMETAEEAAAIMSARAVLVEDPDDSATFGDSEAE